MALNAQLVIRSAITLFVMVLIAISIAGWVWTGAHQAPAASTASRTVLGTGIAAGLAGMWALWRRRSG